MLNYVLEERQVERFGNRMRQCNTDESACVVAQPCDGTGCYRTSGIVVTAASAPMTVYSL